MDIDAVIERALKRERRSIARLISLVEDGGPDLGRVMQALYPHTGRAYSIGITGAPGAGKSSLSDRIVARARADDHKVGVLAIDPSSPFSGGALLGDRVRMQGHATDPDVFIRSMA
ncbi:MAG TPA: methylmalonyl Co-A mutase-associated GTPase MeaB, partial [Actinomycetota bacterium]|nr:methylmalonyl Co-A mutase-associated GTPase MeaB [Actinomycetota bacterium]